MATVQELFNRTCEGLAKQGFQRSMRDARGPGTGSCAYRGANGRKCAIGQLIDDDEVALRYNHVEFRRLMDSIPHGPLHQYLSPLTARCRLGNAQLGSVLQDCHDCGGTPELMVKELRAFAVQEGLTVPECVRVFMPVSTVEG